MLKIAWKDNYVQPLPPGHRFPMEKYELIPEQLLYEGTITNDNMFQPERVTEEQIIAVHDAGYWERLRKLELSPREQRKTGFPHNDKLIEREVTIMGGTLECTEHALLHGISMNIAGGTHHAFTNRGEGFCLLNDIAIASAHLMRHHAIKKILVVDLDVHQGNGTAEIFREDARVFTFSMHGRNNYPHRKEVSDRDIELEDKTDDKTYLRILQNELPRLIDTVEPEFIFFQTGVDVLENDKLGKLGMTIFGCRERDRFVLETCKRNDIPVVCSMGGGYSVKIRDIIEAHANTYRLAQEVFF